MGNPCEWAWVPKNILENVCAIQAIALNAFIYCQFSNAELFIFLQFSINTFIKICYRSQQTTYLSNDLNDQISVP